MRRLATITLGLAMIGLVACGSRTFLDGGEMPAGGAAGGGGAGGPPPSSGGAGGSTAAQGGRGGGSGVNLPPIFGPDGGLQVPGLDAGIVQACMGCVSERCPNVAACATSTACATGVLCTVTRCAGDGGLANLACVSACFGGNWQLALSAVSGLTCVRQGCGASCGLGP